MAISAGYSSSNRPALAYSDGENFVTLNSAGYNATISITRATRPTPNSQDPVMYLSEPYPSFTGSVSQLRPDATEQPGRRDGSQGRRGEARTVQQLQRDAAPSAAGELLGDGRVHRRIRHATALHAARSREHGNEINRIPFDAVSQYGDLLFSNLSSQPQLGIPLPYPGFTGTVQQALRPYPQFTASSGRTASGARPATTRCRRRWSGTSASGFAVVAAYTLSKTEDNYLKQDGSGEEWGARARAGTSRTSSS